GTISKVLTGYTALFVDGMPNALLLCTINGKTRNIEEPISEAVVRGPRVGFTERLSDNTALLRQQGENQQLSIIQMAVGERVKKELVIAYMDGIV
ncbi:spore germination protein, partial [Lysinibacillus sp. D4A3_S15]